MLTILQGDALEQLKTLPDESVQCCVTSPPYWGLRDYGFCSCRKGRVQHESSTLAGTQAGTQAGTPNHFGPSDPDCDRCGGTGRVVGTERQLGMESTPEAYVAAMVVVFREVRRVLRHDGTLWLNLGDSYAGGGRGGGAAGCKQQTNIGSLVQDTPLPPGYKRKDLVGIPWMVAFALRADGWYLRSDIIWNKPNPMPESVTDRPTKAHEYVFLLTKSERYYYDSEAIREPASKAMLRQVADGYDGESTKLFGMGGAQDASSTKSRIINGARKKIDKQRGHSRCHAGFNDRWDHLTKEEQQAIGSNKRTVWTVATNPYEEAHFATFPPDLIKPCILAGCPVGGKVLDPFAGSGTTGMVALELGRQSVLIELNPEYIKLIKQRCNVTPGLALA